MGQIFQDRLHDEFGSWPLAYIPYGGADYGEIDAVARAVGAGDDEVFYEAWNSYADRLSSEAEDALKQGHRTSARELFLRASSFYAASFHPLYGSPVRPLLLDAFRKEIRALDRGLALFEPPVVPLRIPPPRWPHRGGVTIVCFSTDLARGRCCMSRAFRCVRIGRL